MLRSSRKPSYRSSYRSSRKPYQRKATLPRLWVILAAIPLSLIALEVLLRIIVGVTGKSAEFQAYEGEPATITDYRLKFLDHSGQPYDGLPDRGRLKAERSPLMGYRLVKDQQNSVLKINPQGFRSDQPVPQAKPNGEVRIFVLGGSTAFGQMSSSNQTTFANKLETKLNQQVAEQKQNPKKFRPDTLPYFADELVKAMALPPRIREGRYRVINAAVPGYASSNELAQLSLQILPYQPDFIVLVDGYADLLLPSDQDGADVPHIEELLDNATGHATRAFSQQFGQLLDQSYLVKGFEYWVLRPQDGVKQVIPPTIDRDTPLAQRLATDAPELTRRIDRYRNNLQQVARLTTAAKVPLFVAVQPDITSKKATLTTREKVVFDQLGKAYPDRAQAGYTQLQQAVKQVKQSFPKDVVPINLSTSFASKDEAFADAIHLTDAANTKLADQFYDVIAPRLQLQPQPYGGNQPAAGG